MLGTRIFRRKLPQRMPIRQHSELAVENPSPIVILFDDPGVDRLAFMGVTVEERRREAFPTSLGDALAAANRVPGGVPPVAPGGHLRPTLGLAQMRLAWVTALCGLQPLPSLQPQASLTTRHTPTTPHRLSALSPTRPGP